MTTPETNPAAAVRDDPAAEIARLHHALARSEERLRLMTNIIPAQIAYIDHKGVYRCANQNYADGLDQAATALIGETFQTHEASQEPLAGYIRQALAGQGGSYEYSSQRSGDERPHYTRATLVPDVNAEGEVVGCILHALDITEQRRTQAALVQAQKMEAIGQLTGGLAHDFNNLLTIIVGNLRALQQRHAHEAGITEFTDPALQAAQRGVELIKRLLSFSRQQPLEPQPVEVNSLILNMAQLIRRSLPESLAIITAAHTPELVAMVDPHQLENALLNLALNARDAMPNGGELRIEAAAETLTPEAAADIEAAPGDYVQITVSDNGMGMDGSTLARVFEPFFTTKQFGLGSGLGMSMVYGFVRQSGGGVRIRSRQARGTSVVLLLPCALPAVDSDHPGSSPGSEASTHHSHRPLILLVEDDLEVRKIVRMQLTELGYPVLEAENAQEALQIIEHVEDISILLSDIVMPGGMDGRALAHLTRRLRPQIRIILMSGYAQGLALEELGFPFLSKPFSEADLWAAMQALDHESTPAAPAPVETGSSHA